MPMHGHGGFAAIPRQRDEQNISSRKIEIGRDLHALFPEPCGKPLQPGDSSFACGVDLQGDGPGAIDRLAKVAALQKILPGRIRAGLA